MRYLVCRSRPTFLLANRGVSSPCASPYYFLGCNCYLIRFRSSSGSQSTNHSNWRPKLL
uniref:Uncharacterized protein n=1 Tax=Brassica oleracea TaxID=3712 RepID=A0A3P6H253_BRAOL|nr:unnamed protein product [Brassica oleracea]